MDILTAIRTKKILTLILLVIIIALAVLIFFTLNKSRTESVREQEGLTATGAIEAKKVTASFKVAGKIQNIFVEEGSRVEQGQELACLETRELDAKLSQASGAYEAARAQARQAGESVPLTSRQIEAAIEQAQAKVAQAEVGVKNARDSYERLENLYKSGATSDKSYNDAKNNYELAENVRKEAQAALEQALSARLKVDLAQAQYEAATGQSNQAGGAVQEAQAYLDNTRLLAPISGFITQKNLEQGEMVNAGTPVFEISDLLHTYVKVFISEKKIGRVQLGQDVEITVDSFPGRVLHGNVVWINNAGDFAVRKAVNEQYDHDLRSFEVKIDVPNQELLLKTGMTARVRIIE
ncbi:HlyD family secretion protein [Pelotomaculum propionicicum]|uniref:Macrolide export protein MacA n=1 Tax=Pelotomaculum propionicicum TaxID=258475 RepID=A0A4Y7RY15_9FIRM|nr:HlyD family efflux transporter periplasmic adaptor subunit [Pelotomaculum propionicicum]TEB13619.1 Macrolide export protein MacA [Pelotomaculum propionicicum]